MSGIPPRRYPPHYAPPPPPPPPPGMKPFVGKDLGEKAESHDRGLTKKSLKELFGDKTLGDVLNIVESENKINNLLPNVSKLQLEDSTLTVIDKNKNQITIDVNDVKSFDDILKNQKENTYNSVNFKTIDDDKSGRFDGVYKILTDDPDMLSSKGGTFEEQKNFLRERLANCQVTERELIWKHILLNKVVYFTTYLISNYKHTHTVIKEFFEKFEKLDGNIGDIKIPKAIIQNMDKISKDSVNVYKALENIRGTVGDEFEKNINVLRPRNTVGNYVRAISANDLVVPDSTSRTSFAGGGKTNDPYHDMMKLMNALNEFSQKHYPPEEPKEEPKEDKKEEPKEDKKEDNKENKNEDKKEDKKESKLKKRKSQKSKTHRKKRKPKQKK